MINEEDKSYLVLLTIFMLTAAGIYGSFAMTEGCNMSLWNYEYRTAATAVATVMIVVFIIIGGALYYDNKNK